MFSKKHAKVNSDCVACGACMQVCRFNAITIHKGIRAIVDEKKCVGCGMCARECPTSAIELKERV